VKTVLGLGVSLLAVSLALDHSMLAQQLPTFRSSVALVPISAVVRDHKGRLVTNLTASDFEVIDEGQPRRIVDFQKENASPVTVALLVDASGSMRMNPKMTFARQVVDGIVAQLGDGRDEAALFTFDSSLEERQGFTNQPWEVARRFDEVTPWGSTSLHDAIAAAARRLGDRPQRHRALVVVTDGLDTSSALTPAEVSAIASAIDVPVYVVLAVPPIDRSRFMRQLATGAADSGEADLLNLAQWTGGDLMFASAADHGPSIAHHIVSELRHQYVIAIESADRREWRRLDVRVRHQRMRVAARGGYFGRDSAMP
jgi:Ca-activated chloride channel family protein